MLRRTKSSLGEPFVGSGSGMVVRSKEIFVGSGSGMVVRLKELFVGSGNGMVVRLREIFVGSGNGIVVRLREILVGSDIGMLVTLRDIVVGGTAVVFSTHTEKSGTPKKEESFNAITHKVATTAIFVPKPVYEWRYPKGGSFYSLSQ